MALNKAKVYTVTSVKGGVGKTTTLLNLAGVCANLGKKVLIIDLDLYSGDIASILNINYNNDIYNLFEDINNNKFDNHSGIKITSTHHASAISKDIIVQNNSIKNADVGMSIGELIDGIVLKNNTFENVTKEYDVNKTDIEYR